MIRANSLANAVTLVMLILYVACAAISAAAPDFVLGVGQAWVHTINMELIKSTQQMTLGTFVWGAVSLGALTWLVTYGTAVSYNYFVKREK